MKKLSKNPVFTLEYFILTIEKNSFVNWPEIHKANELCKFTANFRRKKNTE